MPIRRPSLSFFRIVAPAAAVGLIATGGCYMKEGPWYSGNAALTYESTSLRPKTISLIDTRTQEVLWSVDVPVDQQLVVAFVQDGADNDDETMPDLMKWQIFDAGKLFGNLENRMPVPNRHARLLELALRPAPEMLLWGMAAYALPFAWIGLSMSVRRAANAGLSPWVGVGFLLPVINWITILVLSSRKESGEWHREEAREQVPLELRTALLSVGIGVALSMSMVATSVFILKDYGWSLFIGTPFVVGVVAGYLTNRSGRRSMAAAPSSSSGLPKTSSSSTTSVSEPSTTAPGTATTRSRPAPALSRATRAT